MSYELIAPYWDKFEKMESMLNMFAEEDIPARSLAAYSASFHRVVDLWDASSRSRKEGTQKRRRLTRDCLLKILDLGIEAFFLCTLSLSIWKLGIVKDKKRFCEALRIWLKKKPNKFPPSFYDFISELHSDHKTFIEESMCFTERMDAYCILTQHSMGQDSKS